MGVGAGGMWYLGRPYTCLMSCSPGSQVDVRTQVFPWAVDFCTRVTFGEMPCMGGTQLLRVSLSWSARPLRCKEKKLRSLLGTGLRMRGHGAQIELELLQLSLPCSCRSLLGNPSVPGVSANLWPFVPEFFDPGPCVRLHSDRCSLW